VKVDGITKPTKNFCIDAAKHRAEYECRSLSSLVEYSLKQYLKKVKAL
jgi:hypothetical protein